MARGHAYRVVADPDDQGLTPLAWALRDGDEAGAAGAYDRTAGALVHAVAPKIVKARAHGHAA